LSLLLHGPETQRDRSRQPIALDLDRHLPPSLSCEPKELGAAVAFENAFFERNSFPPDEPT
jgi:hypothetical protein